MHYIYIYTLYIYIYRYIYIYMYTYCSNKVSHPMKLRGLSSGSWRRWRHHQRQLFGPSKKMWKMMVVVPLNKWIISQL